MPGEAYNSTRRRLCVLLSRYFAMRIVVWNCKMALSRKRQQLYALQPDVAVIPECSRDCLKLCLADGFAGRWFGDNPRKGLGVLVREPFHIVRAGKPSSRWVVPLTISGGPCDFLLVAVWTMPVPGSVVRSYIGQLYEAVANNSRWFRGKPVIVCGDFNSNKFWDAHRPSNRRLQIKHRNGQRSPSARANGTRTQGRSSNDHHAGRVSRPARPESANHTAVVRLLEKHRLASAYHHFFSEAQGAETQPTYYFWHHQNRGYHIDYVFLPFAWTSQITNVHLGSHAAYSQLSDHVPLSVDVAL